MDFDSDKRISLWRDKFQDKSWKIWVAEENSKMIGVSTASKVDDVNEFSSIYIIPGYQGIGVGRKLSEKVLNWLGDKKPVVLTVAKYNDQAKLFYSTLGFENEVDIEPHILPNGKTFPVVKLTKNLSSNISLNH
ncbi:MAG: GNAT family N-acetyltransferase [Candidatus Berkelbacteria bacterium]|nr:GNAT family N-acetyltransferase [Candidatus Berkelbacteria bacterium]